MRRVAQQRVWKGLFDVYIRGKLVLKDFNIAEEAGGPGKPIVKNFTTLVDKNTLKIQFYWAGKGTTGIPSGGVYGPLISAISVIPNFKPPASKKKPIALEVGVSASALFLVLLVLCIMWRKGCLGGKASMEKETVVMLTVFLEIDQGRCEYQILHLLSF